MNVNDILFYRSRAQVKMKIIFVLVSVILHVLPIYYLLTTHFDVKQPEVKEPEKVLSLSSETLYLPPPPQPPQKEKTPPRLVIDESHVSGVAAAAPKPEPPASPRPLIVSPAPTPATATPSPDPQGSTAPPPAPKPFTAPKNFDPRAYLQPENLDRILEEMRNRKTSATGPLHPFNPLTREGDETKSAANNGIVVDEYGEKYFRRKGIDIGPWARAVTKKINEHWVLMEGFSNAASVKTSEGTGTVGITVTLKRDGTVVSAVVRRSSQNQPLDQSALNAVHMSSPFPQIPGQFPGETLNVFFQFNYNEY